MRSFVFFALIAAVFTLLTPGVVFAQQAEVATDTPEEAKRKGDEAMIALRYQDALGYYQRAYDATKNTALLYNMGRAYEGLGDFPRALDALEEFNEKAPADLRAKVPALPDLIRDVKKRVATLVVNAAIADAEIRLGEKVLGKTKSTPSLFRVNAGKQHLVVSREGYFPYERDVALEGGRIETVSAELASRTQAAVLRVTSPVDGASVVLDGKASGVVPVETFVMPGTHKVALSRDGYDDADTSVVVNAGEKKDVTVPLAKKSSILTRWWFWTAIGVVAIGVTTTIILLNTEKDADTGTIPPGQVRADFFRF